MSTQGQIRISPLDRDFAYALDPCMFAASCGIRLSSWQEEVLNSTSQTTILNCARQAGKSTIASIKTAHTAIYQPGSLTLLTAPSLRQACELFEKFMGFYRLVPNAPELTEDNKRAVRTKAGSRVVVLASDAGTVRGYSAVDLLIEDEAAWVSEEYHHGMRPMLAVSGGKLLMMSTPHGKRGHFYELFAGPPDPDTLKIEITANGVKHYKLGFLRKERAKIPAWQYRQEYECEFVDTVDSVFTEEYLARSIDSDLTPLF